MKLGIGITTTPRRKVSRVLERIEKYTFNSHSIYVHNDVDKKGVAYSKNMCIYNLRHCDYIFLLDDDCWPKSHGWDTQIINAMRYSGQNHLLYLNDTHYKRGMITTTSGDALYYYRDCGGVFMSLTKEVVEKVGYLGSEYMGWGFEHAGYSTRIYRSGLNYAPYISFDAMKVLLHANDYDGKNSGETPQRDKDQFYNQNKEVFLSEHSGDIYKPFQP